MRGKAGWVLGLSLSLLAALLFVLTALPAFAVAADAPTVQVAQGTKLGNILTDSQGMTLYAFKKDKPGESMCEGSCAKNWPPVTVPEGAQPMAGQGVPGKLGQIERKDDTYQVTYDGMPLYRFARDGKPGDTNGQGIGGVWNVVPTTASTATAASGQASKGW